MIEPRLLSPPDWSHVDVKGDIEHVLPLTEDAKLPWVNAEPHSDAVDPRVFAKFIAFDRRAGTVWIVRGLLANDDSGLVGVRQVVIEPYNPTGELIEIQSTDLRQRLGEIRDRAVGVLGLSAQLAVRPNFDGAPWTQAAIAVGERVASASTSAGRPALPDEHYERVARLYLELYEEGWRRGILAAIAERMSTPDHKVPRETARDWVKRSRDLGFLSPGRQGRAGASRGARLRPETKEEEEEENDNG